MVGKDEMRSFIKECMAQASNIEDLAKICATIISETNKQLSYMKERLAHKLDDK